MCWPLEHKLAQAFVSNDTIVTPPPVVGNFRIPIPTNLNETLRWCKLSDHDADCLSAHLLTVTLNATFVVVQTVWSRDWVVCLHTFCNSMLSAKSHAQTRRQINTVFASFLKENRTDKKITINYALLRRPALSIGQPMRLGVPSTIMRWKGVFSHTRNPGAKTWGFGTLSHSVCFFLNLMILPVLLGAGRPPSFPVSLIFMSALQQVFCGIFRTPIVQSFHFCHSSAALFGRIKHLASLVLIAHSCVCHKMFSFLFLMFVSAWRHENYAQTLCLFTSMLPHLWRSSWSLVPMYSSIAVVCALLVQQQHELPMCHRCEINSHSCF